MPSNRRRIKGTVISTKMQKTVVVRIDIVTRHPLYGKIMRSSQKYLAHDESGQVQVGDIVQIVETRPISKRKRWAVEKVLEHHQVLAPSVDEVSNDSN